MFNRRPQGYVTYMILEFMDKKPRYGYDILQKINEISGGYWDPSYGTVYGALDRMEEKGYIEKIDQNHHDDRQYYDITEKGKEKLEEGKKWKEKQRDRSHDVILGLLHAYKYLHGEEELEKLLEKICCCFDFE